MSKVNLKDDFYNAINEEWLESAKIPGDKPSTGAFYEINEAVEVLLKEKTKKWAEKKEEVPAKYPLLKQYMKYYDLATDFEKREELGVKPALDFLSKIKNLKNLEQLNKEYANLMLEGYTLPIDFGVTQDFKDSQKQILGLDTGSIILPEKGYYADEKTKEQLLGLYRQTTLELLKKYEISDSEATDLIEATLRIDSKLVDLTLSAEQSADYVKLYNILEVEQLVKSCSALDIRSIIKQVVNENVETILVANPDALNGFNDLISEESFNDLKKWIYVSTLQTTTQLLTEEVRILGGAFNRALAGIKEPSPQEKAAYLGAYSLFSQVVGKYYGEEFFGPVAREDVRQMVLKMVGIYKERLQKNTWLSKETIKKAIIKLENLGIHVGYPDQLPPYIEKYDVKSYSEGGNLFSNSTKFKQLRIQYNFSQYMKPVNDKLWGMPASMVNAYFHPFFNHIVFPAAILQKPFYSLEQSQSANYGGIGAVMAHEISHAFDNNGANFDEKGNLNNWWTDEDLKKFKDLSQAVIDQFEGKETPFGKCNGKLTVSENIADLGGIQCALAAARQSDDFNAEKFFTNWAVVWRTKSSKQYAEMLLKADVHAPAMLRANVQLTNIDLFHETFNTKKGDKMFLDKKNRLSIW